MPREQVPSNVQIATGKDLTTSGTFTLTNFFSRHSAGINLTQVQNNPYQPGVSYRGFVSSFLIGTPPGLSVFLQTREVFPKGVEIASDSDALG